MVNNFIETHIFFADCSCGQIKQGAKHLLFSLAVVLKFIEVMDYANRAQKITKPMS
jgi:hypothetical protein